MFYILKAITAFILPPGLFIVLLSLAGLWLIRRNHRLSGIINLTLGLLIWLASIGPFANEICKKFHFSQPVLVTSGYHLARSLIAFKKAGLEVIPFPANYNAKNINAYSWQSYLASSGSLALTARALHEYLGILYYKLVL